MAYIILKWMNVLKYTETSLHTDLCVRNTDVFIFCVGPEVTMCRNVLPITRKKRRSCLKLQAYNYNEKRNAIAPSRGLLLIGMVGRLEVKSLLYVFWMHSGKSGVLHMLISITVQQILLLPLSVSMRF